MSSASAIISTDLPVLREILNEQNSILVPYEQKAWEEKPIVIDVGANIGGFAIPVAKSLMDCAGKVYCFEPQRIIFQQLCANTFLNRLDNIFTHNVALGENNGTLNIPELDCSKSQNCCYYCFFHFCCFNY